MKVPQSAKKVFSGVLYDVYQWQQKLFDGKTKTFEMLKRNSATQILAIYGNKFVLLEEEQPGQKKYFSIPGGNCEDEDHLKNAKRELLEETGLISKNWKLWVEKELGLDIDFTTYYYIARDCKRKNTKQQLDKGGEKIKIHFLSFKDFLDTVESKGVRNEVLESLLIKLKYNQEERSEFLQLIKEP